MPEKWTSEEIRAYARAIKLYPRQKVRQETKRRQELDNLFERLHGRNKGGKGK